MALNLYVSNSLKNLAKKCSDEIENSHINVFSPDIIITQTDGMGNWLTLEVAKNLGIAANINFLKPNDLIYKVYFILGGNVDSLISRQSLDWLIFNELGKEDFTINFPDLASFYLEDPQTEDINKLSLARQLSDLFDQYQIYRTEQIKRWNTEPWQEMEDKYQWQAFIWQSLKLNTGEKVKDMSLVSSFIIDALKNEKNINILRSQMNVIHLFGLSIITRFHLNIIFEISKYIDFNIYILNPAPDIYWIEDKSNKEIIWQSIFRRQSQEYISQGNELLTNWGKVVRDTFALLYDSDEFINAQQDVPNAVPDEATLLSKIQGDIFNNRMHCSPITTEELADGSIVVASNYTKLREIQALYNYIIEIFDRENNTIQARDILVMVNKIEAYSPFIQAVFKNAPIPIPYNIADEPVADGDTIISSFINLVELSERNFTPEEVLKLLMHKCISSHFGIYDFAHIRKAISISGIRFGIENEAFNDTYLVSWRNGLNRLMYGLCMSDEPQYKVLDYHTVIPTDGSEGMNQMEQITLFSYFVEQLIGHLKSRRKKRTITEWVLFLEDSFEKFIDPDYDSKDFTFKEVGFYLSKYNEIENFGDIEISFDIFSRHFTSILQKEYKTTLFSRGGLTFCSFIPLRSVPFKVIGMLGLGMNDFPRKVVANDFNLMSEAVLLGDRNVRDNDKHLFLETILSASDKLYLSYIGKSPKDNSVLPASVLLEELIEYIQNGFNQNNIENGVMSNNVRDWLVKYHPLHNASVKYNQEKPFLKNYLMKNRSDEKNDFLSESPYLFSEIKKSFDVADIISFSSNPVKFYFQRILGIYYTRDEIILEDTEIFQLNRLEETNIQKLLAQSVLNNLDLHNLLQDEYLRGKLPLSNVGEVERERLFRSFEALKLEASQLLDLSAGNTFPIYIKLNDYEIQGTIGSCYGDTMLSLIYNKNLDANITSSYINYLFGVATQKVKKLIIFHFNENEMSGSGKSWDIYYMDGLQPEDALDRIKSMIDLLIIGHLEVVVYLPFIVGDQDFKKDKILTNDDLIDLLHKKINHDENKNVQNKRYDPYFLNALKKEMFNSSQLLTLFYSMVTLFYDQPMALKNKY